MIDQRTQRWIEKEETDRIARLCDRRFGIGADGLILLEEKAGFDFAMIYFNADGRESTMCGNGGRCMAAFAQKIGAAPANCHFWAIDGSHEAHVHPLTAEPTTQWWVELKMGNVEKMVRHDESTFVLNTGSPHYVRFVTAVDPFPVVETGRAIRYSERFAPTGGINANFVEETAGGLRIRTYERGVEDETLACGTGVTAAALAWHAKTEGKTGAGQVEVQTVADRMQVRFEADGQGGFTNIWLCGPATEVFKGQCKTR